MTSAVLSTNNDLINQRSPKTSLLDHYRARRFGSSGRIQREKRRLQKSHGDLPRNARHNSRLGTEDRELCASAPELVENEDVYFEGIKIRVLEEVGYGSSATVYRAESPLPTPKILSGTSSVNNMSDLQSESDNSSSSSLSITKIHDEDDDEDDEVDKVDDEDDHVVVKVFKNDSYEDKKDIAAERDILLSEHQSPYIVKCFGIITDTNELGTYDPVDDNNVGFVLEYHKFGNINEYLIKNPHNPILDRGMIISFAKDIVKAVHFVHNSLYVIHRDIRSPNFLVTDELKLLLCDFGSARKNTAYNRKTTLKVVKTNPRWTAPELYDDSDANASYTFASDIYSIGIVLWEIFNYHVNSKYYTPFGQTKHPLKIILDIIEGARPDISNDKFPVDFKEILFKTWHQDPPERPNTGELLEMIDRLS